MKKTHVTKKSEIKTEWHLLDADEEVLGRISTKIANLLMGKNKPYFTRSMVCGDKVVVINAGKVAVTGKKKKEKIYYRHTGYIGGLKEESFESLQKRKPGEVIKKAVWGMLPKNKLRKKYMANLYVYPGKEHKHEAQLKIKDNKNSVSAKK